MRGRRLLSSCWAFLAWVAATYCSGQGVAPPAASAEPTGLKVQVIGSAQESIAGERYVAVVPEGQPPSRPVREAVLAKDEPSPSWQLEPGRYRVLCLALGYNGAWLDATELVPGRRQDLQCVLEPTVRVRGRVVAAADGSPVGGGRVRSAHLVAPWYRGRLSPLGHGFMSREFDVTTDGNGSFAIPTTAGGRIPLWVEAAGYDPLFVPAAAAGGDGSFPLLRLRPGGGSLEVVLTSTPEFPSARYTVHITPPPSFQAKQEPVLPRHFLSCPYPETGRVAWPSLPVARYHVWLKGPDDEPALPVVDLGDVDVSAGMAVRFERCVGCSEQASKPGQSADLWLSPRGSWPDEVGELAAVSWLGDRPSRLEAAVSWRGEELLVSVPGGCRPGSTLVVGGRGFVLTPIEVGEGTCSAGVRPLAVEILKAAALRGKFAPPGTSAMPRFGKLVVAKCVGPRERQQPPIGTFPFAIAENGAFAVDAPAGCADLTIEAAPFAPTTFPAFPLAEDRANDLGLVTLTEGAAFLARVVDGRDGRAIPGAAVSVLKADQLASAARASLAGRSSGYYPTTTTDRNGWARLVGLSPGWSHVRILREDGPPHFSDPFELRAGRETLLETIEVPAPAVLAITLNAREEVELPPLDPLRVVLSATQSSGTLAGASLQTTFGPGGEALFASVPPGNWEVSLVSLGGVLGDGVVGKQGIQVSAGEHRELAFDIGNTVFRGEVTLRGEPVEAVLDLYPVDIDLPFKPRTRTDEEGRFSLYLEKPGMYTVQVLRRGALPISTRPIAFLDPQETVRVAIPTGQIAGIVVSADGTPVADSRVTAASAPESRERAFPLGLPSVDAITDSGGRFVIDGLAPGEWRLFAVDGERRSETVTVVLAEGEMRSGERLVLESARITGIVVSSLGRPIRADGLVMLPLAAVGGVPWESERTFRSDASGRFTIEMPPSWAAAVLSRPVDIVLEPVGGPLAAFWRVLEEGMVLQIPEPAGMASLVVAGDRARVAPWVDLALVAPDGAFIPLRVLGRLDSLKVGRREPPYRIPIGPLATGRWVVVRAAGAAEYFALRAGLGMALPHLGALGVQPGLEAHAEITVTHQPEEAEERRNR
ncbi:MAG: carboxypeptidase regulatory-like domain-containing protein [Thermoanaerobaculaceae bacterium]|nr:carboxypeptidase regulatory-like domain-containing protein [Thermoanaerobaculaceae bacterium]MDI9622267.1 carboxypeptidase-like regulatory domain-containing protein [Acidobacteriota bacterium]HPW56318.1 carboxypeptidase-like regulatory domain-containing protein [Thermoanaerobaculaceae bacterium]